MAAVINFMNVDAQLPLNEGGDVGYKSGAEGFKKAKATLVPAFASAVNEYVVEVPAGTSHVNVMATSFSRATVKINGTPGNMSCVDIRSGAGATKIAIVLEENGAVVGSYGLTPKVSAEGAADAEVIMHEKPAVEGADAAPHVHTHGGVPCTADHGDHGHGHGEKKEESHGHSHDGGKTQCTADHGDHGHGHGHGAKKEEHGHGHGHGAKKEESHGHSHDGGKTQCTADHGDHGHGHGAKKEEHGHGHGHGAKKEESHGHSHDGGKTACHEDHGHGHGHGEKKEEHGHGHGHGEKKEEHGHGHGEKKEEHGHGHGHGEKKEEHGHGHGHGH